MSYRHEPRQFWTSQEAEKVSNVFNNTRVPSDDVQRRKSFFFPEQWSKCIFHSSSLVLPSKTCNSFNFHLVVKVKPGDSILPPLGTSVPPNAACSREQPVALGRRRNQPQQKKLSKETSRLGIAICFSEYAEPIELWKRKWGKKNKRWESSPPMADGVAEARGRGGGGEGKRSAVAAHPHCSSTSSSSLIRRQPPPPSLVPI